MSNFSSSFARGLLTLNSCGFLLQSRVFMIRKTQVITPKAWKTTRMTNLFYKFLIRFRQNSLSCSDIAVLLKNLEPHKVNENLTQRRRFFPLHITLSWHQTDYTALANIFPVPGNRSEFLFKYST